MVCSIGAVTSTGVVTVVPFTNTFTGTAIVTSATLTGLTIDADWNWFITLVIGKDRNMHGAYWYPTGTALGAIDVDFIADPTANRFIVAGSTTTQVLQKSASLTLFEVDGLTHAEFIIGATGVTSKISCTLTGSPSV
jgi:hypothetical protein